MEVPPEAAAALAHLLEDKFYAPDFAIREAAETGGHFNAICLEQPFQVGFWVRKNTAYDRERFKRRQQVEMSGRPVWVASPEDTILSKLDWYRMSPVLPQQLEDALGVYEVKNPTWTTPISTAGRRNWAWPTCWPACAGRRFPESEAREDTGLVDSAGLSVVLGGGR